MMTDSRHSFDTVRIAGSKHDELSCSTNLLWQYFIVFAALVLFLSVLVMGSNGKAVALGFGFTMFGLVHFGGKLFFSRTDQALRDAGNGFGCAVGQGGHGWEICGTNVKSSRVGYGATGRYADQNWDTTTTVNLRCRHCGIESERR